MLTAGRKQEVNNGFPCQSLAFYCPLHPSWPPLFAEFVALNQCHPIPHYSLHFINIVDSLLLCSSPLFSLQFRVPNRPCTRGLSNNFTANSTVVQGRVWTGMCMCTMTDGNASHFSSSPAKREELQEHNMPEIHAIPSRSHPRSVQAP